MFTAAAVLSLALGIGANPAIFQLIDAIRLRSLAASNPQELAYIDFAKDSKRIGWRSTRSSNFTSAQWDSLRAHQEAFSGLVAWARKDSISPRVAKRTTRKACSSKETSST
jgi:putative ABC transport system permease protein